MTNWIFRSLAPARVSGPVLFLLAVLPLAVPCMAQGVGTQNVGTQGGDHEAAVAALADLKAAISALVAADASYATDRNIYHRASQQAINALEGAHGAEYRSEAGTPGDAQGAIGHIDSLLDRAETRVWAAPLHGAEANMRAAAAYLQDSLRTRELMDYQFVASRALAYLEVAQGRPTETGVLAGLEGALANTELGLPGDAQVVDGCAAPPNTPSFGVHDGYIAWVAVPAGDGTHELAENPGGTDVTMHGGVILLHTAAAPLVAQECRGHAAAPATGSAKPATQHAAAAPATDALPALYTTAQARAGEQVFVSKCSSCHGANMQGAAAPSVAGNDFLVAAQHNGWTLEIIRYLVFTMMPLNAAHSLSPDAYAAVMAYLLASNCYPAGDKTFPTADDPSFANVKLGPVPGKPPANQDSQGVCKLS